MAGGVNALVVVIPGRGEAASPEPKNTGLWNIDSGFAPLGRPGMTSENWALT
jgi:hypothetical protein